MELSETLKLISCGKADAAISGHEHQNEGANHVLAVLRLSTNENH